MACVPAPPIIPFTVTTFLGHGCPPACIGQTLREANPPGKQSLTPITEAEKRHLGTGNAGLRGQPDSKRFLKVSICVESLYALTFPRLTIQEGMTGDNPRSKERFPKSEQ